jgi:hypothetical protein
VQFGAVDCIKLIGLFIGRMLCPPQAAIDATLGFVFDGRGSCWHIQRCRDNKTGGCVDWNVDVLHQIDLFAVRRFDELPQHMHFSGSYDPRARTDRVYKIRPIVEALRDTFKKGTRLVHSSPLTKVWFLRRRSSTELECI